MDRLDPPTPQTAVARPLEGWHVLVPRAPRRGAGLARLVEAAGGTAVVAPLVSRAEIGAQDQATLDTAVAGLRDGHVAWVAVTSVNAVDELVASAQRVAGGPDGDGLRGTDSASRTDSASEDDTLSTRHDDGAPEMRTGALSVVARRARWAAVGPATARALEAAGITVDLVASENSAVGLLAEWPEVTAPLPPAHASGTSTAAPSSPTPAAAPRVLLPLGDLARPTLEVGLRERGYEPVRVTTYRTVPHPAPSDVVTAWRSGSFDAVVLTSGSVAREVASQLGPREDVCAVAIGEPTHRAAVETGQAVAAVAQTADDDGMLAALLAARRAAEAGETTHPRDSPETTEPPETAATAAQPPP